LPIIKAEGSISYVAGVLYVPVIKFLLVLQNIEFGKFGFTSIMIMMNERTTPQPQRHTNKAYYSFMIYLLMMIQNSNAGPSSRQKAPPLRAVSIKSNNYFNIFHFFFKLGCKSGIIYIFVIWILSYYLYWVFCHCILPTSMLWVCSHIHSLYF
jgi:hypothetical protein